MPDDAASTPMETYEKDPLFINARKELMVTLLAWVVFGLWVVGVSWISGLRPATDPETTSTVLGMPKWVFWGVGLPWLVANVITFWFCFRFMADDKLDVVAEETEASNAPIESNSKSKGGSDV